jgi:hypothetical protein
MKTVSGIITLVIIFAIFGPLLVIWSLNTLFPVLAIPYTLETWFATLVLNGMVFAGRRNSK